MVKLRAENQKMDEKEYAKFKQTVEILELVLLGQLVRFTSRIWGVRSHIGKFEFHFVCRYGAGRYEVIQTQDFDITRIEGLLITKMDNEVTNLIQHWLKHSKAIKE